VGETGGLVSDERMAEEPEGTLDRTDLVDVAWMIGNSAESDVGAADAVGISSVLVVRDRPAPLVEAATLVLSST